jgi:PAS domain S-box-containing protein
LRCQQNRIRQEAEEARQKNAGIGHRDCPFATAASPQGQLSNLNRGHRHFHRLSTAALGTRSIAAACAALVDPVREGRRQPCARHPGGRCGRRKGTSLRPDTLELDAATASFFDHSPHATLLLDGQWNVLRANPAASWLASDGAWPNFADITGLPAPAGNGHAGDPPTSWTRRLRVPAHRDTSRPVDATLAPAPPVGAGPEGERYYAVLCDASEAIQSARGHRDAESRWKTSSDLAPVLIWMAGADMRCEWFNKSWLMYRGRHLGDELGEGWLEGLHPEDLERCTGIYSHSCAARAPFTIDYRLRRHDGAHRWMLCSGLPRFGDDGRFAGYIGTCVDIHERKDLEDRLAEHARMLRLSDRRRESFLARLSHRLRDPLAPIAHAAAILRTMAPQDQRLAMLGEMVERQVGKLSRLVTDLVDVTRVMKGRVALQRETLAVQSLVREATEALRAQFARRGQTLEIEPVEPALTCHGDHHRLTLALTALLDNASKFSPDGATLWLRTQPDGDCVELVVVDAGHGIPLDFLPHVFEMFAQARPEAQGESEGLGVGLTVARRIAELHGGALTVASGGPGTGTRASLRVPRHAPASTPGMAIDLAAVQGQRVLIIEDNADARDSLRMLMELGGNQVVTAGSAAEGLRLAEVVLPNLVVCDIGLPDADGFDVVARLRRQPGCEATRFVALTGHGLAEDRDRALESGFDAFQVKPLRMPSAAGPLPGPDES